MSGAVRSSSRATVRAIRLIARRELLDITRDGRFRTAAVIVAALLAVALGAGWSHHRDVADQQARAQAATRAHWLAQPAKDPHSAAHYGIYAFKPRAPLTLFDTGVEPYTGVAALLEAHKQNEFQFRPAQDRAAMGRFGELTAAATLQLLVPLLIVLLAVEGFAGEREQGTLRLLCATGVAPRTLAIGKLAGMGAAIAAIVLPAVTAGAVALVWSASDVPAPVSAPADGAGVSFAFASASLAFASSTAAATLARAVPLAGVYLAFFLVVSCVSLAVSARAASSRRALAILMAAWAFNAVAAPRIASEIGRARHPAPTAFAFAQELQRATYDGQDVHTFIAARARELKARLLREHGVSRVQDLPVNLRGVDYLEREAHANDIFDEQYGALWRTFARQNQLRQWASLAAPLLALRGLSAALAGTDFAHHQHFAAAAEAYRRTLVRAMNENLAHGSTSARFDYTASADLWRQLPPFTYRAPSAGWALAQERGSLAALGLWMILAIAALGRAVSAMRVD